MNPKSIFLKQKYFILIHFSLKFIHELLHLKKKQFFVGLYWYSIILAAEAKFIFMAKTWELDQKFWAGLFLLSS